MAAVIRDAKFSNLGMSAMGSSALLKLLLKRSSNKLALVFALAICCLAISPVAAETNEQYCDRIGHSAGTDEFNFCVKNLREMAAKGYSVPVEATRQSSASVASSDQACEGFGFARKTTAFSNCVLRLEVARTQAVQLQQQYELEQRQYERAVAAQAARERAAKEERDRQKWLALARFGAGMANSGSSSFAGAMADGNAAMLGIPATPPPTPPVMQAPQSFTIHTPRGAVVTCVQRGTSLFCN